MLRNGDISPIAVKRAVRGYWWVPVVSSVALGAIAVVAVWVLPKKYTSRTAVLVEEPTVPQEYVKPVVTEDVYHRLASMQGQILSDTRLVPVVEKLGLASQEHSDASVQKAGWSAARFREDQSVATDAWHGRTGTATWILFERDL